MVKRMKRVAKVRQPSARPKSRSQARRLVGRQVTDYVSRCGKCHAITVAVGRGKRKCLLCGNVEDV